MISTLNAIRRKKPLVLCLTNYVTMNDCANALLAIGASPVMSLDQNDALELMDHAHALVVNIGTANQEFMNMVVSVIKKANDLKKPVILDPVGAGATSARTQWALQILKDGVSILRGNKSEVFACLNGQRVYNTGQKGVDSDPTLNISNDTLMAGALSFHTVIAMTGATDTITDGTIIESISIGTPLFEEITGAGCILSSILGAFTAVQKETSKSFQKLAYEALYYYSQAGEKAALLEGGVATFHHNLFDQLSKKEGQ